MKSYYVDYVLHSRMFCDGFILRAPILPEPPSFLSAGVIGVSHCTWLRGKLSHKPYVHRHMGQNNWNHQEETFSRVESVDLPLKKAWRVMEDH